jgi:hypothetical protein
MSLGSSRKPRRIGATATYLNAGLWGSRFVGYCEVGTNGEQVWLKGHRVPVWMAWARAFSFIAFLPVGFYAGIMVGETVVGRWGYPPYYYLASMLLTFLLVVLGLWGAGIWNETLGSYEALFWSAAKGRSMRQAYSRGSTTRHAAWKVMNTHVKTHDVIQVEVPIGPDGKPRRLVLKTRDSDANSLLGVLSGVYYGQPYQDMGEGARRGSSGDPWGWSRN